MDVKAAKDLLRVSKLAQEKLAEQEVQIKLANERAAAAMFVLESIQEGRVDPNDALEFFDKVAEEGVAFFKKAVALGLPDLAEGFGSLIERKDVSTAGLSKTASLDDSINGEVVDHFSRGVYELKSMLYGEPFPYDL